MWLYLYVCQCTSEYVHIRSGGYTPNIIHKAGFRSLSLKNSPCWRKQNDQFTESPLLKSWFHQTKTHTFQGVFCRYSWWVHIDTRLKTKEGSLCFLSFLCFLWNLCLPGQATKICGMFPVGIGNKGWYLYGNPTPFPCKSWHLLNGTRIKNMRRKGMFN